MSAAAWANDTDTVTYARLTSVSGADTTVGTGPASMTAYAVGQVFRYVAAGTNTTTVTLNITPSGGAALGAKAVRKDGTTALVAGDILSGQVVTVVYDGTVFQMQNRPQTMTGTTLTAPVINGSVTTTGLTLPAFTLGGTIAGGGNQLNNVIIGTSTPLAGSFTTLAASTSVTVPMGGTATYGFSGTAPWLTSGKRTTGISTATIIGALISGDYSGIIIVHGSDGTNMFLDQIMVSSSYDATAVISQTTIGGSPAVRTYTVSGNDISLAMASGTYTVTTQLTQSPQG